MQTLTTHDSASRRLMNVSSPQVQEFIRIANALQGSRASTLVSALRSVVAKQDTHAW